MPKLDITKLLTTRHLERAFGVTSMTIYLWRKGTPTKAKLPVVETSNKRVFYSPAKVEAWAKKNEVAVLVPSLVGLLGDDSLSPSKSGPIAPAPSKKRATARSAVAH